MKFARSESGLAGVLVCVAVGLMFGVEALAQYSAGGCVMEVDKDCGQMWANSRICQGENTATPCGDIVLDSGGTVTEVRNTGSDESGQTSWRVSANTTGWAIVHTYKCDELGQCVTKDADAERECYSREAYGNSCGANNWE